MRYGRSIDTIAAVFAIIGVNNLLSVDIDILSTLGEAIAVSPQAALFLLYVVQELDIKDGYISEVVDFAETFGSADDVKCFRQIQYNGKR